MAKLLSCCLVPAILASAAAGAQPNPASVSGLSIRSMPAAGDTYGVDEMIAVEIRFDGPVNPVGPVSLPLQIGAQSRSASYGSCTSRPADPAGSCRWLLFHYRIAPSDIDVDGISVAAGSSQLGGGSITDLAGDPIALDLGNYAIVNDRRHKVDGGVNNGAASSPS